MSLMGSSVSAEALAAKGVSRGFSESGFRAADGVMAWRLDIFYGRLAELSGGPASAALTLACGLVLQAQENAEPVAWILDQASAFYPPDVAAAGVDLDTLAIVRLPDRLLAPRAADQLIRSGAFGLVVLDLGARVHVPMAVQTRLVGLARKHRTAIVCLTEKTSDEPSLGSLVSFRAQAVHERRTGAVREAPQVGAYGLNVRVLKDKQCGVGWRHQEVCGGVDGLY